MVNGRAARSGLSIQNSTFTIEHSPFTISAPCTTSRARMRATADRESTAHDQRDGADHLQAPAARELGEVVGDDGAAAMFLPPAADPDAIALLRHHELACGRFSFARLDDEQVAVVNAAASELVAAGAQE